MNDRSAHDDLGALRGARVLLGVTGGIACYKAVELVRLLLKSGADVEVVMTESATRFVGPLTFSAISRHPVHTDVFATPEKVLHVALARGADLIAIAPATANVIAKMTNGIADDLLTNVLLAARAPVVIAPAMHTEMWEHPATVANVRALSDRGITIVDPDAGELAGGDEGVGRLAELPEILSVIARTLEHGRDLAGVRFIVTAGATQEPIDPVRYITNRSSGKMGYAIATEAARRGAAVTLVSGPSKLAVPDRVELVAVRTVAEMRDAVLARFDEADVVVKAAAVSDFRVRNYSDTKIKKTTAPTIELVPNPDIAAELGARKTHQVVVGFAAETNDHLAGARKKLAEKNLDLIVMNPVDVADAGFDVDTNRGVIIGSDGSEDEVPLQLKSQVARALCDRIAGILAERHT